MRGYKCGIPHVIAAKVIRHQLGLCTVAPGCQNVYEISSAYTRVTLWQLWLLYPSVKLDSCALFILNFLSQEPETRDKEVVASKLFYFSEKFCCRSGLSVADVTISSVVGMTGLIHASAVHSPVARFESAWFVPVAWSRFMLASVSGPNGLQIWLIRNFSFQNEILLNLHAILVFLLHNLYAILLKWTF